MKLKELRMARKLSQQKMADYLHVSRSTVGMWETGASQPDMNNLMKIADYFGVSIDYLLDYPPKSIKVPVLGKVAAGIPIEAIENIEDYEEIAFKGARTKDFFALKLQGDSMAPRMESGDVVIVRRQPDVDDGDIAVVLVNSGNATVKRVKKMKEGILLVPINPAYEPCFYTWEEISSLPVSIIGKVVELRAKF